ncbi:MAG: phospholipid carrier-dependent glycosyltransferase [Planctomycetia bacterium]|nr:phospholipid carrier-dependent glycosyltransferase [Planctomycetia bacterium]
MATQTLNNKNTNHSCFVFLILFALFVRGSVLFSHLETFDADPDDYGRLAENLSIFHVFGSEENPTAFRPPLYPYFLSLLTFLQINPDKSDFLNSILLSRNATIALFHWILGLLTVFLVYRIALECHFTEKAACCAAFLVAVDPILLQQSRLVMTETFAVFWAALILFFIIKLHSVPKNNLSVADLSFSNQNRNWNSWQNGIRYSISLVMIGILLGLSVLCRPTFLAFAGLLTLYLAIPLSSTQFPKLKPSQRFILFPFGKIIIFLIGLAIPLSFWAIRNEKVFQRPIITTTHSGYTFFLANNDDLYDYYHESRPWLSLWDPTTFHDNWSQTISVHKSSLKDGSKQTEQELLQDSWAQNAAWDVIERRPGDFVTSIVYRIGNLWQFLPYAVPDPQTESQTTRWIRYAIGLFYLFELGFALIGTLGLAFSIEKNNNQSPCWIFGFLLILSIQIPHLIFWTNMRMRAPFMIFIPLLTLYGIGWLYAKTGLRNKNPDR